MERKNELEELKELLETEASTQSCASFWQS